MMLEASVSAGPLDDNGGAGALGSVVEEAMSDGAESPCACPLSAHVVLERADTGVSLFHKLTKERLDLAAALVGDYDLVDSCTGDLTLHRSDGMREGSVSNLFSLKLECPSLWRLSTSRAQQL